VSSGCTSQRQVFQLPYFSIIFLHFSKLNICGSRISVLL
jgi:hypothetical protein